MKGGGKMEKQLTEIRSRINKIEKEIKSIQNKQIINDLKNDSLAELFMEMGSVIDDYMEEHKGIV